MSADTRRFVRKGDILPTVVRSGGDSNRSTLLVLPHPEQCAPCAAYLDELEEIRPDLQEWATRLQVLDHHEARQRLGVGDDEAAVILADRWGEVFESASIGFDHDLPLPRQLVESAKILDVSCGECNVPGPEWQDQ